MAIIQRLGQGDRKHGTFYFAWYSLILNLGNEIVYKLRNEIVYQQKGENVYLKNI